ncbi:2-dehydro-3-deoxygalactonokinase [Humitalea rosea]|uniref:2-dehydro-3-deoxygalactonokinase n=1 Tax=Humitalea rosea TaxID=990373 RepID=A0A2W7II76_9PROT|nr:2-dehydro-3-deoxygalactonokinase [Humitalea rosea]PZW45680.1 2-dehydro-3-deoxygalactonokinase [Humitalea rosea]
MIGVDWGTTNFRAWWLGPDGGIRDHLASGDGLLSTPADGFAATLARNIGPWLAQGETRILLCGMVGSRQGWREAPYLGCPADAAAIAAASIAVEFPGAEARIIPGLTTRDADGCPDVARGEETKAVSLLARLGLGRAVLVLPGTHCKWIGIEAGRITGFTSHMTGEVFATLARHSILGRTLEEGAAHDAAAFARGVVRARQAGGVLHHLFGVRAMALVDGLDPAASASFLSGLLIGHEILAAMPATRAPLHVLTESMLGARYAEAFDALGIPHTVESGDVTPGGLVALSRLIWTTEEAP